MEQQLSSVSALVGLYGATVAFFAWSVAEYVPRPYMDEIFHVGQTQRFCDDRWDAAWDGKITTLPGLYVLPVLVGVVLSGATGQRAVFSSKSALCSVGALRAYNVVVALVAFLLLYKTRRLLHGAAHSRQFALLKTLEVATHPVYFFFHFLFYTDTMSTFLVVHCYYLSLKTHSHVVAALVGALAVFVRQTNVVWVVFVAVVAVIREYESGALNLGDAQETPKEVVVVREVRTLPVAVRAFVVAMVRHWSRVLAIVWPYVCVVAGFGVFVVTNGGIVVGDKTNHQAVVHVPQLLYFFAFAAVSLWPHVFTLTNAREFIRDALELRPLTLGLCYGTLTAAVGRFTYAHPFLLADNRHFTFYVWKNFFRRGPVFKYMPIPLYAFGAWALSRLIGTSRSLLWQLVFVVCVALVLVPSPLLEPRYFILPLVMLQLHEPSTSVHASLLAVVSNVIVNAAVWALFIGKPFRWPDGSEARFMW